MSDAIFFGLIDVENKDDHLIDFIRSVAAGTPGSGTFGTSAASFERVPGSPFCYWAPDKVIALFETHQGLEQSGFAVRKGLDTNDDFRFFRLHWEPQPARTSYVPIVKGGPFARYYSDPHLVIDWTEEGKALKEFIRSRGDHPSRNVRSENKYFHPGFTWSQRSQAGLSVRVMPAGCLFSTKGPGIIIETAVHPMACLGILNSSAYNYLIRLQMAFGSYDIGLLKQSPIPSTTLEAVDQLGSLALLAYHNRQQIDTWNEVSHVFLVPSLVRFRNQGSSLELIRRAFVDYLSSLEEQFETLQDRIDIITWEAFGFEDEERQELLNHGSLLVIEGTGDEEWDEDPESHHLFSQDSVQDLVQWLVGVVVGRWDVRIALQPARPQEPTDPFVALPAHSPGTLIGPDGSPARSGWIVSDELSHARPEVLTLPENGAVEPSTVPDVAYPLRIDWDGILVDDEGHPDDVVGRVREALVLLWPDHAETIEQEACEILSVANLREYFRNPRRFWEFHVRRYSKSRRKAPIYWLLQSSKRSYGLLLYYHRMDADILYKALRSYVDPKVAREQHRLEELESGRAAAEAAGGRMRREHERSVDRQRALLTELEGFRHTLERVALLDLTVDHDDGVLLSIAPLHELVPWKPATQAWNELVAGKYEWSTMAQRMREKGLVRGSGRQ